MIPFLVMTAAVMILKRRAGSEVCACEGGSIPCPCPTIPTVPGTDSGPISSGGGGGGGGIWVDPGGGSSGGGTSGGGGGGGLSPDWNPIIIPPTGPHSEPTHSGEPYDGSGGSQLPGVPPPFGKPGGVTCPPFFCLPVWGGGQTWYQRYGIPDNGCCRP